MRFVTVKPGFTGGRSGDLLCQASLSTMPNCCHKWAKEVSAMGHERKRRQEKRKFHGNFRTAQKKVSEGSISSEKLGRGLSDTLFNVDSKLFLVIGFSTSKY
ncbi:hypothetical protein TNCV_213191 [Trichonephila clavipes]|nr:hypothetical protein TNCV_213191 [Trichonephila clavipes]